MAAKKSRKPVKKTAKASPATVLVLRSCDANMRGYGGFVWPKSGPVSCPDWKPEAKCGNGLHGLLWGEGDGSLLNFDETAKWLVVEVLASEVVNIGRKVKFPRGTVVFCGTSHEAAKYIGERAPKGVKAIVRGTSTSGDGGTSTSGDGGTSTSGYRGTSTSGVRGTSTSGDGGTSTSGDGGTSTSGDGGTSTSGVRGTSISGEVGILVCRWFENKTNRHRLSIGYVGEDGIRPNTKYRADAAGKIVEVAP